MVTKRYEGQRARSWWQPATQTSRDPNRDRKLCDSTSNGTDQYQNGSSKLLTPYREQPRSIQTVVAYPLPAFSFLFLVSVVLFLVRSRCVFVFLPSNHSYDRIYVGQKESIGGQILIKYVVVFFTLTDRASTIPSNIRGCQSGTLSAGQKKIRGTSTKLQ